MEILAELKFQAVYANLKALNLEHHPINYEWRARVFSFYLPQGGPA